MKRWRAVAALSLLACGPSARAKSPEAKVEAANLSAPTGTTLVQACTPTGPELCFNATDDNCNGVIDEGCGTPTGVLQFVIAWNASVPDVDLALTLPSYERISTSQTRPIPTAFHKGPNCPADDGCHGQNLEYVYFDGAQPLSGHYTAEISLVDLHGADAPVKVRFGARLGSRIVGFDVDLSPGDDSKKTFSFDIP